MQQYWHNVVQLNKCNYWEKKWNRIFCNKKKCECTLDLRLKWAKWKKRFWWIEWNSDIGLFAFNQMNYLSVCLPFFYLSLSLSRFLSFSFTQALFCQLRPLSRLSFTEVIWYRIETGGKVIAGAITQKRAYAPLTKMSFPLLYSNIYIRI